MNLDHLYDCRVVVVVFVTAQGVTTNLRLIRFKPEAADGQSYSVLAKFTKFAHKLFFLLRFRFCPADK